jgi:putative addiction module CopG family antidote
MNVTLSDSLKDFVEKQVNSGRYANADAFVEDLVRSEAELLARVNQGEPLPVDEHFPRRLEALLDEAEASGDYVEVSPDDFDAMERDGIELLHKRRNS